MKDKQEELKKKNELLDEYVKQFVNVNEDNDDATEVVESENQTVTIKKMVFAKSFKPIYNFLGHEWRRHRLCQAEGAVRRDGRTER